MSRKAVSKRLRFEIFKRDGFKCVYCGANAAAVTLHADHVVPLSEGGATVHENLVTACAGCNHGKSNVPLSESRLSSGPSAEELIERAEQIRAYMAACKELAAAQAQLADLVLEEWCSAFQRESMPQAIYNRSSSLIAEIGIEKVLAAVRATAAKAGCLHGRDGEQRYFFGVVKAMRGEP